MENLLNQFGTYEEAREFSKRMIKNANTSEDMETILNGLILHKKRKFLDFCPELRIAFIKWFMFKQGLDIEKDKTDIDTLIKDQKVEDLEYLLRG